MPAPKDPIKYQEWLNKLKLRRPSNLGKKFSEKWRKNLSEAHKGFKQKPESVLKMIAHHLGEKSHFWKGGVRIEKSDLLLRECWKNGSRHSIAELANLKEKYNGTCPSCLRQEPEIKLTTDHIIPLSKGGGDNIENIQFLCLSCNSRKHDKIIKY